MKVLVDNVIVWLHVDRDEHRDVTGVRATAALDGKTVPVVDVEPHEGVTPVTETDSMTGPREPTTKEMQERHDAWDRHFQNIPHDLRDTDFSQRHIDRGILLNRLAAAEERLSTQFHDDTICALMAAEANASLDRARGVTERARADKAMKTRDNVKLRLCKAEQTIRDTALRLTDVQDNLAESSDEYDELLPYVLHRHDCKRQLGLPGCSCGLARLLTAHNQPDEIAEDES